MVLSACSPYFKALLEENPAKHPIIILKDVPFQHLTAILEFMYIQRINIHTCVQIIADFPQPFQVRRRGQRGPGPAPRLPQDRREAQGQRVGRGTANHQAGIGTGKTARKKENLKKSQHNPLAPPKKKRFRLQSALYMRLV